MLDSIALKINKGNYSIRDPNQFLYERRSRGFSLRNCTASLPPDVYRPNVVEITQGFKTWLKVEFSAPKLLFGENLSELQETDLGPLAEKLVWTMNLMGVEISVEALIASDVNELHVSKNIPLKPLWTPQRATRSIEYLNPDQRFEYMGYIRGETFYLQNDRISLTFYDKLSEMEVKTPKMMNAARLWRESGMPEILRFEIRLLERKKIKETMDKVVGPANPTLRDVFREELCQKILMFYWETVFKKYMVFNGRFDRLTFVEKALTLFPKMKLATAIKLVGTRDLARSSKGLRGLREVVARTRSSSAWKFLTRDLEKIKIIAKAGRGNIMRHIERALKKFELVSVGVITGENRNHEMQVNNDSLLQKERKHPP